MLVLGFGYLIYGFIAPRFVAAPAGAKAASAVPLAVAAAA
jgi:hypothetical protein